MRRFDPVFGFVSERKRRAAELFYADLMGVPSRRMLPRARRSEAVEQAVWPAAPYLESFETDTSASEAVVGNLSASGQQIGVDTSATPSLSAASFHDALLHALAQQTSHTVILGDPLSTGAAFAVHTWGPATSLPGPLAVDFDAAGVAALIVNGGQRVYMQANLLATAQADRLRWVHVPGLREFLRLPTSQQTSQRGEWVAQIRRASVVNPSTRAAFTQAELTALSTPTLRLLLAHHAAAAYPVRTVNRGKPPTDRGGVMDGVTLPMLYHPISEPQVYLRVISRREGRMESINAWDLGAGVSLGPVQINVQRGTLFRFLWRVWEEDRSLFQSAFGAPLNWSMRESSGVPELQVTVGQAQQWLRGTGDATAVSTNSGYFQSGTPGRAALADLNPAFRRTLAERFRGLVAWPHIQGILEEVCAGWLQPGLEQIHRAGIPALDRNNPDRDTFILKALLMSTYVRYSGCLQPLLDALGQWTSVADKLANWRTAVASMTGACNARGTTAQQDRNTDLVRRLGLQQTEAGTVFTELQAVIAAGRN